MSGSATFSFTAVETLYVDTCVEGPDRTTVRRLLASWNSKAFRPVVVPSRVVGVKITPVSVHVGAEVSDVDLRALTAEQAAELAAAWGEYGVLFFRDQELEPDDHIVFAEHFGSIDVNKFFQKVESHPQIAQVLKEPDQKRNIGSAWHTDHSYDAEPARGSILVAREVPPTGGDTLFLSVAAAYDALSDGLKTTLLSLRARHSNEHVFGKTSEHPKQLNGRFENPELTGGAEHPVVIKHPVSGRPCLYVNRGFTTNFVGWTEEESAPLLEYLYEHTAQPEFTYRFSWEEGSIAMWDNRSTWHFAENDYHGHRRLMHRITVAGEALASA